MKTFELQTVQSVDEALGILSAHPDTSKVLAGGTALINLMKQGLYEPGILVDLSPIAELRDISDEGDAVCIGAMVSLTSLQKSALVQESLPFFRTVLTRTAHRRLRNVITIGGCLAHGEAASDPSVALMVLGATVHIRGAGGPRIAPIEEFFKGFYETAVGPEEVLAGVSVPKQTENAKHAYYKFTPRSAYDKPTLGVGVKLVLDADTSACVDSRIVLGNAGPVVSRVYDAEGALNGRVLDPNALTAAGELAAEKAEPFDDVRGSEEYKREMIRILVPRTIRNCLETG